MSLMIIPGYSVTIQMKAIEQIFHLMLFVVSVFRKIDFFIFFFIADVRTWLLSRQATALAIQTGFGRDEQISR